MIDNKTSYSHQDRNLSEVFKELQAIKNNPQLQSSYIKRSHSKKFSNFRNFFKRSSTTLVIQKHSSYTVIISIIVFLFVALFFDKKIFANTPKYEINNNSLDIQKIIVENANINTFKEQAITEYNIVFPTIYTDNSSLPKGEEVITKEGVFGKQKVTSVKTYENGQVINELILSEENLSSPTPQYVDVGTSEFLAKHKIHIGDTLYVIKDTNLKKENNEKSEDVTDIKEYLDVKLLELTSEDWCKVSFDDKEGYLKTEDLTSASSTPDIVEKCRIKRILINVDIDMELNKSSGLTKDDFKKVLSDIPQDKNKILENNYEVFYDMDQKYNINGIFLASIAIHESNWGVSTIANDKKNLFGYGAYDRSPYDSSYSFSDYSDGIETVAKALAKYYLNTSGTKINDDETAVGSYYNEPTLKGVNTRYASDKEWYLKVFKYMELLYDRL